MEVLGEMDLKRLTEAADKATVLMKTLGHRGRLLVLCQLAGGEKSVGELSNILDIPQSPLSQHLSRMRKEALVQTRRDAQTIYYSLKSDKASKVIECLYQLYCADES